MEASKQETLMTFLNNIQKRANRGGSVVLVWVMVNLVEIGAEEHRNNSKALSCLSYSQDVLDKMGYILETKLLRRRFGKSARIQLKARVINVAEVSSGEPLKLLFKLRAQKKQRQKHALTPRLVRTE